MTNRTLSLAGVTIHRLGYGTMRLVGEGAWGEPKSRGHAHTILRTAVGSGINFIDTADAYGPEIAEELIYESLHPYPADLVIATKGGITRQGPAKAAPVGRPEYLHQCVEMSLRRLHLETIPLYQLHRIDPQVPMEDSLGKLVALREQGKLQHIGLSEVTVEEIQQAQKTTPIVSVQNKYNLSERKHERVLEFCTENKIAFIPWYPVDAGRLNRPDGPLAALASRKHATTTQLSLAWLLHKSPLVLPIPGTYSLEHLKENIASAEIELTQDEVAEIERIAGARAPKA
jgi:aryl-alcohol dehydrogenase-like predicted oxidoreductase